MKTRRRIMAWILAVVIFMGTMVIPVTETSAEENYQKKQLKLNSENVSKTSIQAYQKDGDFYITIDDLCALTRSSYKENGSVITITHGCWTAQFDVKNQLFSDGWQEYEVPVLTVASHSYAVPALMFLSYFKAAAWIEDDTLYCRTSACTPWEAMAVDFDDSLADIYELYGGEGMVRVSLTLDLVLDLFTGDLGTTEDYLRDAYKEALSVNIYENDAVKEFVEREQEAIYEDLHSVEGSEYIGHLKEALSVSAEPTQWLLKYYYNREGLHFANLMYEAHYAGEHVEAMEFSDELDVWVKNKKDGLDLSGKNFENADYLMLFVCAAVEAMDQVGYIDATDNLVYRVLGSENLKTLGLTVENNDWFTVANEYTDFLSISKEELKNQAFQSFVDKTLWEKLAGAGLSKFADIKSGTWMFSLNVARILVKNLPGTSTGIEAMKADRKAITLSELQQNVYWIASESWKDLQNKKDVLAAYKRVLESRVLYCRTSIAMYENLITMVEENGKDKDKWKKEFNNKIDDLSVKLYQLTRLLNDNLEKCMPMDLESFQLDSLFEEMPDSFVYTSGAGGWATTLTIEDTGRFKGHYGDSNMGEFAEEYPYGTVYVCDFEGVFTEPELVENNIYKMELESLDITTDQDKEYIQDGTKYVPSFPYGMQNGKTFYVYAPGADISQLPDIFDILFWTFSTDIRKTVPLDCYIIYNETDDTIFYGLDDNAIWAKTFVGGENGYTCTLRPSMNDFTTITFSDPSGDAIPLSFEWDTDETLAFDIVEAAGDGMYYMHLQFTISEDRSTIHLTAESELGRDLSGWGGTTDGKLEIDLKKQSN